MHVECGVKQMPSVHVSAKIFDKTLSSSAMRPPDPLIMPEHVQPDKLPSVRHGYSQAIVIVQRAHGCHIRADETKPAQGGTRQESRYLVQLMPA